MRNNCLRSLLLLTALLQLINVITAQGYQALHGSSYAGSIASFNNPASPVNGVYKWDLTLFSAQAKTSTNAFYVSDNLLKVRDGYFNRGLHLNGDFSMFNFSFKPDHDHAITVNFRGRTYNHANSLAFNYTDSSIRSFHTFLIANRNTAFLEGSATHAGWLEADLNYSQVISETDKSRLTGGVTLQVMRSLSGAFARVNKISYLEAKSSTDTSYTFTNGTGSFGYSDNYDNFSNTGSFIKNSRTSMGLSLGVEYLVYPTDKDEYAENNLFNYDWKIGISLMDIGANLFSTSKNSVQFADPNAAVTDAQMDSKLSGAANIQALRDSINSIFNNNNISTFTDKFSISLPTRFTVNVDKNLGNHFYLNGELNMNFYAATGYTRLHTSELNLLTVTPRWETIGLGFYLPVQYNSQGQFSAGAAIKLGPVVIGIHNLGVLKKDPSLNGGGYMLLSLHPFSRKRVMSNTDCMN